MGPFLLAGSQRALLSGLSPPGTVQKALQLAERIQPRGASSDPGVPTPYPAVASQEGPASNQARQSAADLLGLGADGKEEPAVVGRGIKESSKTLYVQDVHLQKSAGTAYNAINT